MKDIYTLRHPIVVARRRSIFAVVEYIQSDVRNVRPLFWNSAIRNVLEIASSRLPRAAFIIDHNDAS